MLVILGTFLAILVACSAWLSIGIAVIHATPMLFGDERAEAVQRWMQRAPGLDVVIFWCTAVPMLLGLVIAHTVFGSLIAAAIGFATGWLAMMVCVVAWSRWHEQQRRDDLTGARIVTLLNAKTGRFRNHAALWVTALVVPVFWIIRFAEIVVYPWLTRLVKLPAQNQAQWVNVSRHKFEGLVGHDLIWCLYCDWMTGVWSLGTEMLRNVESFWCPIRFADPDKCARCKAEFPDVEHEWVPHDGTMQDVHDLLDRKLVDGNHSWFGHPSRVTVEGEPQREPDHTAMRTEAAEQATEQAAKSGTAVTPPEPATDHGPDPDPIDLGPPSTPEETELDEAADDLLKLEEDDEKRETDR